MYMWYRYNQGLPQLVLKTNGARQGSGNIENWIGPADDVIT